MSVALLGRAIAVVGIVCGLLAIGLPQFSGEGFLTLRYVDDGTAVAFLLVLLSFASWFPAEVWRDRYGAAAGAAAFGFFLFVPAVFAFDSLGTLDAGAWLGLCSALIPIGYLVVRASERKADDVAGPQTAPPGAVDSGNAPGLLLSFAGLAVIFIGIWFPAEDGGKSFWNLSFSGHAVGILMLILVAANAALLAVHVSSRARVADIALLVAATTFGLVEWELIWNAFESFGSLGSGGWLEACGGVLLLFGTVEHVTAAERAPAGMPSAAAAQ